MINVSDNKRVQLNWSTIRQYLFYFLIFILPWQTRWIIRDPYLGGEVWEYGRISLYGWDILLILLVIISWPLVWTEISRFFIRFFSLGVEDSELRSPSSTPNNPAPGTSFILLIVLAFVSIVWSGDKLLALAWSLRFLEAGMLWLLVKTLKPKWIGILWSLVAAGFVQAVWAIWQFLAQSSFANKWLGVAFHSLAQGGTSVVMNEYGRWLRAYAGQVHPNVLGGLLVITCLATVYLFVAKKSEIRISKFETSPNDQIPKVSGFKFQVSSFRSHLLLLLYVLQLAGLFFTFSRGAWLALFISIVFWWWKERNFRWIISKVILLSGAIVLILGAIYWQPISGRFTGQSALEQRSIEDRRGSVKESGQLLSSGWFGGAGIGNYTAKLSETMPNLKAWRYQPVHNILLLIFTELGVIGLILFLLILWRAVWPFGPPPVGWHNSLFIIPVLVTAQFDHYWWTAPSMFLLFWLIITFRSNANTAI